MRKIINVLLCVLIMLLLPITLFAWSWDNLWRTPDQQGALLLQKGLAKEALARFKNQAWLGVAAFRAKEYAQSYERFSKQKTSDGQYNAGNAAAFLGRYPDAIAAYDKAIALNPNNKDAIFNRDIIRKLLHKKPPQNNSSQGKNPSSSQQDNNKKNNSNNDSQSSSQNKSVDKQQKQDQQNQQQAQNKEQKNNENSSNSENARQPSSNQNASKNDDHLKSDNSQGQAQTQQTQSQAQSQAKEEQNQLMRRLDSDPGGLLRQKFLRDYYKRHGALANEGGN